MDIFAFQTEALFDTNRLISITEGDEEFAQELLKAAVQSMQNNYEKVTLLDPSDSSTFTFAEARDTFHALKSSSLNIGCNRLGKCAESLEFCSKNEDFQNSTLLLPLFHKEYKEALFYIQNHL